MANKPTKEVPAVFQRMHDQVTAMLAVLHNKIGLEYALYSEDHGINIATKGMVAGKPAKRKRIQTVPFGAYASVYKPLIENLQPDGYARIPVGKFKIVNVQSAVSAWCSQNWGNGTYTCLTSKDKSHVELWRYPTDVDASLINLRGTRAERVGSFSTSIEATHN